MAFCRKKEIFAPIDKIYPYTIYCGWGQESSCTLEDLREIEHDISEILKEVDKNKKPLDEIKDLCYNKDTPRGVERGSDYDYCE